MRVKLPNKVHINSSHVGTLPLPQLPPQARRAHIIPGLASHSLISVVKLCNAGCDVKMNDISCTVWYHEKTMIDCSKCIQTGLWMMPLTNDTTETAATTIDWDNSPIHYANNSHQTSTRAELAQFHHQSLFSPPTTTILKALKNNQL